MQKLLFLLMSFWLVSMGRVGFAQTESDPPQKTPELWEDPDVTTKNESALFLGGHLGFGQTHQTGGSTPGTAVLMGFEPGFMFSRGSWSRVEASLELDVGGVEFREKDADKNKVDMPVGLLFLAKFGYGYSLGKNAFGILRFGVGPVNAKYQGKNKDGIISKSTSAVWGLAGKVGLDVAVPMSDIVDFVGGISLTHMAFDIDEVEANGVETDLGKPINLNIPMLAVGLRAKI